MKITEVSGNSYYEDDGESTEMIVILESGTIDYYHVIIDDAFQNNKYFHMTKSEIEKEFKITI